MQKSDFDSLAGEIKKENFDYLFNLLWMYEEELFDRSPAYSYFVEDFRAQERVRFKRGLRIWLEDPWGLLYPETLKNAVEDVRMVQGVNEDHYPPYTAVCSDIEWITWWVRHGEIGPIVPVDGVCATLRGIIDDLDS